MLKRLANKAKRIAKSRKWYSIILWIVRINIIKIIKCWHGKFINEIINLTDRNQNKIDIIRYTNLY